jgi:hypothetical protein
VGVLLNNYGAPPTTTELVSNANPANPLEVVTYAANVTSQSAGSVTGTVTFEDGGGTIATLPLLNNQASYSTSYKKVSAHAITASYWGELHVAFGSESATLMEYVPGASRTVLTTSGSPSFVGQPVTFTATVTSAFGKIPVGELVTFSDGTATLGSVALVGGTATYTTSALSAKGQIIKATYAGCTIFKPSDGTVKQVVDKYATTTALGSSANPSSYKQAITFTATVASAGPAPTGKVTFKDGATAIGTVTLSGGLTKLTTSKLVVGTHTITAEYLGDADSATSTSAVLDQVVQ